jgi:hypothetical protein
MKKNIDARTDQGRQLARRLYDYKINRLEQMSPEEKKGLISEFPLLGETEFQYVVQQLISAKRFEQERVGWQAVPHDAAVLILILITSLAGLRVGIVAGVAVLVLLESIFQFIFNRRVYQILSVLVWFTYPAYFGLAYVLYRQGYTLGGIAAIVLLSWGGTYLLGIAARIPSRLILEAMAKSEEQSARKQQTKVNKK